ncbi:hypothetical protein Tco_0685635 [Tanacetum coccineum]
MCRIHREYMDLEAHDDVCTQLPYALLGNQKWNLPVNYDIVIHSKRSEGIGENDRVIPKVAAYWSVDTSYLVADGFSKMVSMKRLYKLVFGNIARGVRGRRARWIGNSKSLLEYVLNKYTPRGSCLRRNESRMGRGVLSVEGEVRVDVEPLPVGRHVFASSAGRDGI